MQHPSAYLADASTDPNPRAKLLPLASRLFAELGFHALATLATIAAANPNLTFAPPAAGCAVYEHLSREVRDRGRGVAIIRLVTQVLSSIAARGAEHAAVAALRRWDDARTGSKSLEAQERACAAGMEVFHAYFQQKAAEALDRAETA